MTKESFEMKSGIRQRYTFLYETEGNTGEVKGTLSIDRGNSKMYFDALEPSTFAPGDLLIIDNNETVCWCCRYVDRGQVSFWRALHQWQHRLSYQVARQLSYLRWKLLGK